MRGAGSSNSGDLSFANVVLFLQMNGVDGATIFPDSSIYAHTPTAVGDAQIDAAQSKFGGGSALLDGVGDVITVPDNESLELGSGDFTVEFFVRFASASADSGLVGKWGTTNPTQRSWRLTYHPGIGLRWSTSVEGATIVATDRAWTAVVNTWYHIAVSRAAGVTRIFVDGAMAGATIADSAAYFNTNSTGTFNIGAMDAIGPLSPTNGWFDEIRVTKGVARYQSNFAAPANPYPTGLYSDPYFSSVVLLMRMDGADGAASFPDESANAHTATAIGNAQIDTAQSKFGGGSALIDGSGDVITIPDHASLEFGSGDFTAEFFVRFAALVDQQGLIGKWGTSNPSNRSWRLTYHLATGLRWSTSIDGATIVTTDRAWTPVVNTWYHIAVSRVSGVTRLFVDGVMMGATITDGGTYFNSNGTFNIGAMDGIGPLLPTNGWFDEVRLTKGVARYQANFVPPSAPYVV